MARFHVDVTNDGSRRKSVNGTIRNIYKNNYDQYIDVGATALIKNFILKNRSSVCATIWGHGGVGKTAMVQRVCEQLSLSDRHAVDYIVFASAKDRAYSHQTASIVTIDEPIDSYRSLLKCINTTIGCLDPESEREIVEFKGTLLIVIDDYETFPAEDREKIAKLVDLLNAQHHKVLITTRANVVLGKEFRTDELPLDRTIRFLVEVTKSVIPRFPDHAEAELRSDEVQRTVFRITSGRPLFILQFAHIWAQSTQLSSALSHSIGDREEAIEFLYGRIYEYLSSGKALFRAISVLVRESDLTNLVGKLRYILNMETDPEKFDRGMEELIKLRVVEIFENGVFRVYSIEILAIMRRVFDNHNTTAEERGWKNRVVQRTNRVTGNRDTDQALLEDAKSAKGPRSEQDVVDRHREILNRDSSPISIRSAAILSLTDYLFRERGKKAEAIAEFAPSPGNVP